jgi:hypothetical protein
VDLALVPVHVRDIIASVVALITCILFLFFCWLVNRSHVLAKVRTRVELAVAPINGALVLLGIAMARNVVIETRKARKRLAAARLSAMVRRRVLQPHVLPHNPVLASRKLASRIDTRVLNHDRAVSFTN